MTWILFDEADHMRPAPYFCLPAANEQPVCLRDYHEDCNLVLIFAHTQNCRSCLDAFGEFAQRRGDYMAEDAKILIVVPETVGELASNREYSRLPFTVLSDPDGTTRQAYASLMAESLVGEDDTMVFVLDRYNAPYAAWIDQELDQPTLHNDILSWLAYIGVQCPE